MFNFEGGCYAKAIKLSREAEPEIYATTERFGTVMENVVLDPDTRVPDFDDDSKTENTRVAYPLDFIPNASRDRPRRPSQEHRHADLRRLRRAAADRQARRRRRRCITSCPATPPRSPAPKRASTEPQATFSTCFGAPFMPLHPTVYGNLLRDSSRKHHVDCWLVNTGWTGGKYGTGRRMPIRVTRRLLAAALDGSLHKADFRTDPYFGLAVPTAVPGVEPHILDPGQDLGRGGGVRRDRQQAGENVPRQFRHLRAPCRRQGPRRRPGDADRRRISVTTSRFQTPPGDRRGFCLAVFAVVNIPFMKMNIC